MPRIQLPSKFKRVLFSGKRFIILIGGRGSAKSESVGRLVIMKAQTEAADILCGREFQSSIDDSVHKLLKGLIDDLGVKGFNVLERRIDCLTGGGFRFKGFARNSSAVKSAQGFKYAWIEEAQTLSEESIRDLTPTIRAAGSQLFFTANPMSSADPFSQRFIVPYLDSILRDGYYEDDMHLIIMMNWRDNPWFPKELEQERQSDYENLPRAMYDHIWEGAHNDHVDNAIIAAEWFDAAIDAHLKLGFKPRGAKIVSHDPSDKGPDAKGLAYRHGSVVLDVREKDGLDVNEGCDWATDYAIDVQADAYIWDADGIGAGLRRQTLANIRGKKISHLEFRGSKGVDDPRKVYQPTDDNKRAKTNEQTFKNRRAQYYWALRDRFYNTYRAVEFGEYKDPDSLISLSSEIECMSALRAEVCRIPRKPSGQGLIQIMSKEEMARLKPPIPSPNMADSLMMCESKLPDMADSAPLKFVNPYA